MADLEINVRVTPRVLYWLALGGLLFGSAADISTESFTMSTTYPAPTGVYNVLITTGNTYLARDGGNVGVGTTNPQQKLDVAGSINAGQNITAVGTVSGGDVQVGGKSCITKLDCSQLKATTGHDCVPGAQPNTWQIQ